MGDSKSVFAARVFGLHGDVTRLALSGAAAADQATLARVIGGDLEIIPLGPTESLALHAEGKLCKLPVNSTATALARRFEALLPGDYIAGVAVAIPNEALYDAT